MKYRAARFDTRSIQSFIYAGNKLKTNVGASYLVENLFRKILREALEAVFGANHVETSLWMTDEKPMLKLSKDDIRASIAYSGGGNALVLADMDAEAELTEVVRDFSRRVLVECPGLGTGAALGILEIDEDGNYGESDDFRPVALVRKLKAQQSSIFPRLKLPYTGLTLNCEYDGEAACAWDETERRFFSWGTELKLQADRDENSPAEQELMNKLREIWTEEQFRDIFSRYRFPRAFDEMGQKQADNYYAIVHIDGNNMGVKFTNCNNLFEHKRASREVRRQSIQAFAELVEKVKNDMQRYADNQYISPQEGPDGRMTLPLRPLVLGGDDMTFVCVGSLALEFTEWVIRRLKDIGMDSCGGIVVLPTAYPFSRGYFLAEDLCSEAKKENRGARAEGEQYSTSCWLDFVILHGEQGASLDQLREREYTGSRGENLHFGPYRVDSDSSEPHALDNLIQAIEDFRKLPRSKVKEMRDLLTRSEHERHRFMEQLRLVGEASGEYDFPHIAAWQKYEDSLMADGTTPYIDVIEMMEFHIPEGDR